MVGSYVRKYLTSPLAASTLIALAALIGGKVAFPASLRDVSLTTPNGQAVTYLEEHGVISGFSDGTFRGNSYVNRAEAAKILLKAGDFTLYGMGSNTLFRDVPQGVWYEPYVVSAKAHGIMNGYPDGSFGPERSVIRAEFIKMLTKAFRLEEGLPHSYVDVPEEEWFASYAGAAKRWRLFLNESDVFAPALYMTRNEVAWAVYQAMISQEGTASSSSSEERRQPFVQESGIQDNGSTIIPLSGRPQSSIPVGCSDSDVSVTFADGRNPTAKGLTSGPLQPSGTQFTFTDSCISGGVREYFCTSEGLLVYATIQCSHGCQDGVCLLVEKNGSTSSVSLSDGGDEGSSVAYEDFPYTISPSSSSVPVQGRSSWSVASNTVSSSVPSSFSSYSASSSEYNLGGIEVGNIAARLRSGLDVNGDKQVTQDDAEAIVGAAMLYRQTKGTVSYSNTVRDIFDDPATEQFAGNLSVFFADSQGLQGLSALLNNYRDLFSAHQEAWKQDLFSIAFQRVKAVEQRLLYIVYKPDDPLTYVNYGNDFVDFLAFAKGAGVPSFRQNIRDYLVETLAEGRTEQEPEGRYNYRRDLVLRLWDEYGIFTCYWRGTGKIKDIPGYYGHDSHLRMLHGILTILKENPFSIPQGEIHHIVFWSQARSVAGRHAIWYNYDAGYASIAHEMGHIANTVQREEFEEKFRPAAVGITEFEDTAFFGSLGFLGPYSSNPFENFAQISSLWYVDSEAILQWALQRALQEGKPVLLDMVLAWLSIMPSNPDGSVRASRLVYGQEDNAPPHLYTFFSQEYSMAVKRNADGNISQITLPGGQQFLFSYSQEGRLQQVIPQRGVLFSIRCKTAPAGYPCPVGVLKNTERMSFANTKLRDYPVIYSFFDPFTGTESAEEIVTFPLEKEGVNTLTLRATDSRGNVTEGDYRVFFITQLPVLAFGPDMPRTTQDGSITLSFTIDGLPYIERWYHLPTGASQITKTISDLASNKVSVSTYVCSRDCPHTQWPPFCGDGIVDPSLGESCDDGNDSWNDGCYPTCVMDQGYRCNGEPSRCTRQ